MVSKEYFFEKLTRLLRGSLFIFLALLAVAPHGVSAQVPSTSSQDFTSIATAFGLGSNIDARQILINIIRLVLSFTGLLSVIIVLYAGFTWMTSFGSEERIARARATLRNGLTGLIIVLSAYALVTFVMNMINGQI